MGFIVDMYRVGQVYNCITKLQLGGCWGFWTILDHLQFWMLYGEAFFEAIVDFYPFWIFTAFWTVIHSKWSGTSLFWAGQAHSSTHWRARFERLCKVGGSASKKLFASMKPFNCRLNPVLYSLSVNCWCCKPTETYQRHSKTNYHPKFS